MKRVVFIVKITHTHTYIYIYIYIDSFHYLIIEIVFLSLCQGQTYPDTVVQPS